MAWAMRHRSVSPPHSSNRTCRFPASGFAPRKAKRTYPASPPRLLLMQWTAPTRRHLGAKMVVDFAEPFESACGYKETSSRPKSTSA